MKWPRRGLLWIALAIAVASCGVAMTNTLSDDQSIRAVENDVDALIQKLTNSEATEREAAAHDLGANGERARKALPALLKTMKEDSVFAVRVSAAYAVWRVEPDNEESVTALRTELIESLRAYGELAAQDEDRAGDSHWDKLFESLNQVERIVRTVAQIGPGASMTVTELTSILEHNTGEGYVDLVPDVANALDRMGPAARPALPALRAFRDTPQGSQNNASIDAAIASIETGVSAPAEGKPITNTD